MLYEIKIPEFGDQIENIVIIKFLKLKGEKVHIGDDVVELETDKASFNVQAEVSGFVAEWMVAEKDIVKRNQVVGTINTEN